VVVEVMTAAVITRPRVVMIGDVSAEARVREEMVVEEATRTSGRAVRGLAVTRMSNLRGATITDVTIIATISLISPFRD